MEQKALIVGSGLLTHFLLLQDLEERPRRMDKLRRSLRSSLRRKKDHSRRHDGGGGGGGGDGGEGERGQNRQGERGGGGGSSGGSSSRGGSAAAAGGSQWQMDEVSVRSGTCSFQVKVR